jgi:nitric oxide reductase FlRd-NAD(+) reductase
MITNTRVTSLNTDDRTLITEHGERYSYSKLVLATGANTFVPPALAEHQTSLLTMNSLQEFTQGHERLQKANTVAVIGGGLIGVELALDLQSSGKEVTIVEPAPTLLASLLPRFIAGELENALTDAGVQVKTRSQITHITDNGLNKTLSLDVPTFASNEQKQSIDVDELIVAAGLKPNIALAKQAGIATQRGILVNEQMQTSAPDVYAIGDCAEIDGQIRAYLQPAILSANVLAKQLIGQPSKLALPHMMTKVKTPKYPILFSGTFGKDDRWEASIKSNGIVARAFDDNSKMVGFVVTGEESSSSFALFRELQTA